MAPVETFIYALIDPDSDKVRYVGKADSPRKRLSCHLTWARQGTRRGAKERWLLSLMAQGKRPRLKVLEQTTQDQCRKRELYWIAWYFELEEGADLTNSAIDIRAALESKNGNTSHD